MTMFEAVSIPFGAKMLFNTLKLKPGVDMSELELALGEMCNVVKNSYGGERGGFIAGQVFRFTGFVSGEGSLNAKKPGDDHVVIVTYWHSFEAHEKSHADATFRSRFSALMELCSEADEIGYEMLWQGEPEL